MSNFVLLFQNFSDDGALSGGNWLSALPLANVQDPDPGRIARSSNALNASTKLEIDLGGTRPVGGVALGPLNTTPGSSYRVKAFSDAARTTVVYDSGTKTIAGTVINWSNTADWLEWEDPGFWLGVPNSYDLDVVPTWIIEIIASADLSSALAQYWQIDIFDDANSDGYVQFGRLLVARSFRPAVNYAPGDNATVTVTMVDTEESLGGRRSRWNRGLRRTFRASFPGVSDAEAFGDLFRIQTMVGTDKQVFVVPDPADTANLLKRAFLATVKNPPALAQLEAYDPDQGKLSSTVLEFEEEI